MNFEYPGTEISSGYSENKFIKSVLVILFNISYKSFNSMDIDASSSTFILGFLMGSVYFSLIYTGSGLIDLAGM